MNEIPYPFPNAMDGMVRPRPVGNRYYVELLDQRTTVWDSLTGTVARSWNNPVDVVRCPLCGGERSKKYHQDANHVREAIELCQQLNSEDVEAVIREMNEATRRTKERCLTDPDTPNIVT